MGGGGGQIETRVLFNKRLYGIVSLVGRQSEYIKLHSRDDQGAERAIEPQAWANTPPPSQHYSIPHSNPLRINHYVCFVNV